MCIVIVYYILYMINVEYFYQVDCPIYTVYNWTVLKNGSCCTVQPGKVSCLQKFRHFWMIIRDLFFESRSTEPTKIKQILQRYVIYISDQITVPYMNTETGNRRLNIVDGMFSLEERG